MVAGTGPSAKEPLTSGFPALDKADREKADCYGEDVASLVLQGATLP